MKKLIIQLAVVSSLALLLASVVNADGRRLEAESSVVTKHTVRVDGKQI